MRCFLPNVWYAADFLSPAANIPQMIGCRMSQLESPICLQSLTGGSLLFAVRIA
jgi:hypothetical protein